MSTRSPSIRCRRGVPGTADELSVSAVSVATSLSNAAERSCEDVEPAWRVCRPCAGHGWWSLSSQWAFIRCRIRSVKAGRAYRCHSSSASGQGVTGSAAQVGEHGDLVDEVGVLGPAGGIMAVTSQTYSWFSQVTTSSSQDHTSARRSGSMQVGGSQGRASSARAAQCLLLLVAAVESDVELPVCLLDAPPRVGEPLGERARRGTVVGLRAVGHDRMSSWSRVRPRRRASTRAAMRPELRH
jgi:hypothetical protein